MKKKPKLDYIFHPETFALVGASDNTANHGRIIIEEMLNGGYEGKIFPVTPYNKEILGLKCYSDIRDIPDAIDHVLVGIKAENTPELMKVCAEKKVKVCHFFASGFSELDTQEGIDLQKQIVEIARDSGMRIIGPNSMGIYCPSSGLSMSGGLSYQSGNLGLLSQSGGNVIHLCRHAAMRGAPISKAVSYGNACDMDESDLLEYFAEDDDTKVIGAYIEGIKDGGKFLKALRKAASAKPTIILKGGKTEYGSACATSHTGSMAGSGEIWDGIIRQAGAIQAESLEEILDISLLFLYMKAPAGRRVGVIGLGGGVSVMAADSLYKYNFELPDLPATMKKRLSKITPNAGSMFTNPVDVPVFFRGPEKFDNAMKLFSEWKDIDLILLHSAYEIIGWPMEHLLKTGLTNQIAEKLSNFAKEASIPTVVILHSVKRPEIYQLYAEDQKTCWEAGVPVLNSIRGTVKALDKFIEYHDRRK